MTYFLWNRELLPGSRKNLVLAEGEIISKIYIFGKYEEMELVWSTNCSVFSYAYGYGYAYVELVTSENSKKRNKWVRSSFVSASAYVNVAAVFNCPYAYALVKIGIKGTRN